MSIRAGADPKAYEMLLDRQQVPLPYYDYNENDGVYIMNDGGLSVMFECAPYGGATSEAGLITALSSIPEGAAIQFILYPSPDITKVIDNWKGNKVKDNELYAETANDFADFVEKKTKEIMSENMRTPVSNFKLIVALSLGGKSETFSIFDNIGVNLTNIIVGSNIKKSGKKDRKREYQVRYNKILDLRNRLKSALTSADLFPLELKPNELIRFIYPILNPNHDFRHIPEWKGDVDGIADNCIANDTVVEVADDHIKFDNKYARSMSVKDYSYDWHCAFVDQLIGNPFGTQLIESNVLYCLNVINLGKKGKNKVKRKSSIILYQNLPDSLFPLLGMKKRDLQAANKALETGKEIFHINYAIVPMANSYDELNNVCGQVQAYYQRLGFTLEEDKYINLPILLSMLPGNYDEKFKDDLKRGIVVFLENAVDLAPTSADWRGNTHKNAPQSILFTPRGQIFPFDFFESETNFNAFLIGTSGSGKSVCMQNFAMDYLMSGNKVSILDIGGSYENFCNVLGGEYIDIKPESPLCINPWTDIIDEKTFNNYAEFLADWYWLMGAPQDYKLNQEHIKFVKSWLNVAIKHTFETYGSRSNVDTVISSLKLCVEQNNHDKPNFAMDNRVSDFIQVLTPYMSSGIYGAFFNGKSEINLSSRLMVLEIGSMENIPALRDPIIMMLFHHVSKNVYQSYDGKLHLVMIDEAHKFLGNPMIDVFVEQAYRRFRKHDSAIIIGTQGYEDLVDETGLSRAGRVIIDNSAYQFFLNQSSASTEKLKNSNNYNFSPYDKNLIDSIKPVKGEYSEGLMVYDRTKVKVRFFLSDLQKRLFFTTSEMRLYIREKVKLGMTFIEAVKSMPKDIVR